MSACPNFKIDSNDTGLRFAVERCLKELPVAAAGVAASGTLSFNTNALAGDTIQVGSTVFTFVAAAPAANEILIGATVADTATAVATAVDALANVAASAAGFIVTITAQAVGTAGNAISLDASGDVNASGSTLTGAADEMYAPTWHPLEPNSYGDMGANISTVARNPINPSRQRQKGVVTDLEATASFTMDLTGKNHLYMMQGFNFAYAREKPTTAKLNAQPVLVTSVTVADGYLMDDSFASQVAIGDIVLAEGFGLAANNGVKLVTAVNVGEVMVGGVVAEAAPPATAKLTVVGVQGASGDFAITVGADIRLTATTLNLTTLGLLPGEWIYIGGDAANTYFSNNRGFARIGAIAAGYLILDKTTWTPQAQSGAGLTIQLFFGTVIRNEENPDDIVRSTFQFERTLGEDQDGTMSQYIIGSVANELTLNVAQADKVTAEMAFIACDAIARAGSVGVKPGNRPALVASDAFNTSSDVRRLAFTLEGEVTPLFVYATDLTLTIGNNASGLKAIGVLGNMDVAVGTYDVGGSVTAYFQDVRAVNAVRNNESVSMDLALVKDNMGIVFDIPLMTLGNGMVAVEQDQAITVPLDMMAAQSSFGHTLLYVNFPYLPSAA